MNKKPHLGSTGQIGIWRRLLCS